MTFPTYSTQDCPRAWEAMPWVLQNTAPPEQSDWLRQHLAGCAPCRAEYAQQNRLQRALSLPTDVSVNAEAGLQRLLGRLDMPQEIQAPARVRASGWLTRALVAAVLLQGVGIGALGLKMWSAGDHPAYRTLSQAAPIAAPGSIRVVPDAGMTLGAWNTLLRTLQLQIVSGPNDVGAYTVAPTGATSPQQALQQLRAAHSVRLAEPVSATP